MEDRNYWIDYPIPFGSKRLGVSLDSIGIPLVLVL